VPRVDGEAGIPPIEPVVLPFGDDALLVDLREAATIRAARRARALASAIVALAASGEPALAGVGMPVAAASSVLVPFAQVEHLDCDLDIISSTLRKLAATIPTDPPPPPDAREHIIHVRYGGADGEDLERVAVDAGLTPDAVVRLHGSVAYEVLFLGFAPGFGYLGELPGALRLPRLATPRVHVPGGSVAIAGPLTAVYPQAGPGGWRLLGRTDARLFDPSGAEPTLLRPGDLVRFVPA
jgi:KipI family sensor histidine kinase inhibitor